jgi:hypothetical protein
MLCPFCDRRINTVLSLYYYWLNLGPLTRGSSAVGFAVLVGSSLALDLPVRAPSDPPRCGPRVAGKGKRNVYVSMFVCVCVRVCVCVCVCVCVFVRLLSSCPCPCLGTISWTGMPC